MKKHDTRFLIGRIAFLACGKSDTRHLIGLHRFANKNLLCGFSVCKSQYVYNKSVYHHNYVKAGMIFYNQILFEKNNLESYNSAKYEGLVHTNFQYPGQGFEV